MRKLNPLATVGAPCVLDVECGTQSCHHGGVTMLCLSSTFMYEENNVFFFKQRCPKMLHL
jgi:hypothetical protein